MCDRNQCNNQPEYYVGFMLWSKCVPHALRNPANAASSILAIKVCFTCKGGLKAGDVVDDRTWTQILQTFTDAGKATPDRDSIRLKFRPLNMGFPTGS